MTANFACRLALGAILGVAACGSPPAAVVPAASASPAPLTASFDYVGQDWMRFDATVADKVSTRLILDTGGGVTLLSKALCERVGCVADGTYSGKRMSGQELVLPMARVSSLVFAGHRVENMRVAVLDTTSLLHPDLGVEGFVGMDAFRDQPITFDYEHKKLVLESEVSLAARKSAGSVVTVHVKDDGTSVEIYLPCALRPGLPLEMEVDSGSRDVILDERFMKPLAIDPNGADVKRVDGKDETQNSYVRYFTKMPQALFVGGGTKQNPSVPAGSTVMFQKIIHDGLVGHTFLSAQTTSFDLKSQTMIFALPR